LGVTEANSLRKRSNGYACNCDKFGFMGGYYP
jgi:hypothetical protein